MPMYKFIGNKILTWIENNSWNTPERIPFRIQALLGPGAQSLPFERNSNGFHFDTEIIIQLVAARIPILELPIPTYYGDEICRVTD